MPTSIGFNVPYSVDLAMYDCNRMDRNVCASFQ